ncbi:winged helix-turn-helix domain-containing protein [Thermoactinospora rubra]|uniref:winged helix-turn-helix domain-containing protein n=1 Tax=Thermoactinospora rubra TaxID=1088767 RepID=UPI000A11B7F8|nr:crosslink repair DNA glycosylase YcaQ family protein [Thermoactinospora rubra]
MTDLTAAEARRLVLRAQGFVGADARKGGVAAMLRRLGAVQLDTVSVLARSHELVAYARLGAVGRRAVERAYWHDPARSFEYWCHAACILPIEHWPLYGFRRRGFRARGLRWHTVPPDVDKLLERVRQSGPVTTSDVGGARNGGPWWDWSDSKIGLEWLLDIGELVCTRRVGWRRVYDLAERAVPAELLGQDLPDEECIRRLAGVAGRSLGVATRGDLVDFLRVRNQHAAMLDEALLSGGSGLVPVTVAGWPPGRKGGPNAWADPALLASDVRGRHRTTLVSPFDSLIWHRGRTERVFGFTYTLELYVPKAKRVHGYFTMPVLAGGRLIGRVDPAREGSTLVARQVHLEPGVDGRKAVEAVREALWSAAAWVGCDSVRVERSDPPHLAAELAREPA